MSVFALALAPAGDLAELQDKLGEAVTLLADPDGLAVRAFQMVDPAPFPPRTIARSGTFYIDRKGEIRARWFPKSYRRRPDPDEVLAGIRAAD